MTEINVTCPAITPSLGTEILSNGNMETGDPPTGWSSYVGTLSAAADERTGGAGTKSFSVVAGGTGTGDIYQTKAGITYRNNWYHFSGWVKLVAGTGTMRLVASDNIGNRIGYKTSTSGAWEYLETTGLHLSTTSDLIASGEYISGAPGDEFRLDDLSLKKITFSSMIVSLGTRGSNTGIYSCHPVVANGTQAGLIIDYLDNNNFVLVVVDRVYASAIRMVKCVAGVYTTVLAAWITDNADQTYVDGTELKVVTDGSNFNVYYGDIQVGEKTVIDTSGMGSDVYGFSSYSSNQVGDVITAPCIPFISMAYIFPTFKGQTPTEEHVWFLGSNDGFVWSEISAPFTPVRKLARDSVMLYHGGQYWISYATMIDYQVEVATSLDGIFWDVVAIVDMTSTGCTTCGGSDWFVDSNDSVYLTVMCSNDGWITSKPYLVNPTNAGMTAWSAPVEITGTGFPTATLEFCILKIGTTYYGFINVSGGFAVWSSTSLTSGYTLYKPAGWSGWPDTFEGISIVHLQDGKWRTYFDSKNTAVLPHDLYYSNSTTTDMFGGWGAISKADTPFPAFQGNLIYCSRLSHGNRQLYSVGTRPTNQVNTRGISEVDD